MRLYKRKVITRLTKGDKVPYIVRYSIFNCRWFAVKVHNILISDDDCLHDHPWAFLTIILNGGYWEYSPMPGSVEFFETASDKKFHRKKWYGRFSVLYRHLHYIHRLELPPGKTAWTLVVTFKKRKPWGFFTKTGWVEWFNYNSSGGC